MMNRLLTLTALFLGLSLNGQILVKDSQIKDRPDGETLFKLNSEQEVYTFDPEDGWFRIRKIGWVPKNAIDKDGEIAGSTELTNWEGEVIGMIASPTMAVEQKPGTERQTRGRVEVVIEGFVYKFNIDRTTIPEEELFEFLNADKKNNRYDLISPLMQKFGFEEEEAGDLKAMVLLEKNRSLAPDRVFRMILIFRGESSLVAVLTRDHEFPVKEAKGGTEKNMDVLYTWFVKPNPRMKEPIEELMWSYLPL